MTLGTWESQLAYAEATRGESSGPPEDLDLLRQRPEWYYEGLDDLEENVKEFYVDYAKLEPDEVVRHIETVRQKAYGVHPYPCIGAYRFLHHAVSENPLYKSALETMKADTNARFLDIGCCLGQEARQLAIDGVPSSQLLGIDLEAQFFDHGFELFNDRSTFQGRFFQADVLDDDNAELKELEGTVDVVFVGAFLHLFTYEVQLELLLRIMKLLKPKAGVKVLGRQNGNREPGTRSRKSTRDMFYQHDVDSFKEQFNKAADITRTRWTVDGELRDWVEWRHGQSLGLCGREFNGDTVDLRFWTERIA